MPQSKKGSVPIRMKAITEAQIINGMYFFCKKQHKPAQTINAIIDSRIKIHE